MKVAPPGRIKVVFGVNDFLTGGMQRQLAEQMRFYDRERFSFALITLFDFPGKPTMYNELPPDLEVHRLNFSGVVDIASWWRSYRLLMRLQPDVVVSSLFFANMVFRLLKPFVGYAAIAREHNTYTDKPLWQRIVDRVLAPLSYRIVAVSGTVASFTAAQEGITQERFMVIHNGVDSARVTQSLATLPGKPELQEETGLAGASPLILNVSRLISQKQHELLIEGFALYARARPRARLAIVGEGPRMEKLVALAARCSVADAVVFFGHHDDVLKFYKMADIFVSTSAIEGLSNAYLEALAAGLPLVATKTAGTDELIEEGKNGFYIEPRTPEAVCSALEKIGDGVGYRDQVLATARRFDIRTTVKSYEALFLEAFRAQ